MARRIPTTLGVLMIVSLAAACEDTPRRLTPLGPSLAAPGVTGIVEDTFGEPISGALVEMIDGPLAGRSALTTSVGRFAIPLDGRSPQGITLRISKEGFSPVSRLIEDSVAGLVVLESTVPFTWHGDYTLTVSAAGTCADIPSSMRRRTYTAKLRSRNTANGMFTVALGGVDFYPGYATLFGSKRDAGTTLWVASWAAFENWMEEQPIFERLPSSEYLSFVGLATTTLDPDKSITLVWDGTFAYCLSSRPDANPLWPPVCAAAIIKCDSTAHQLTLVRQ